MLRLKLKPEGAELSDDAEALPSGTWVVRQLVQWSRRGAEARSWIDEMRCSCNGIEADDAEVVPPAWEMRAEAPRNVF